MGDLVYLKNDEAVCDSLQVAEKFGKRHGDVIRTISNQRKNALVKKRNLYMSSNYTDAKGELRPMYLMNRQGFEILVMGFTGEKALEWKLAYSDAFGEMESFIREKQSQPWQDARTQGKLTRRSETDTLKRLVEYAESQGSKHADKLYLVYSKLANSMAGIQNRDSATVEQISDLAMMENIIRKVVQAGIQAGKNYKDIYQDCKGRLETVREIACVI